MNFPSKNVIVKFLLQNDQILFGGNIDHLALKTRLYLSSQLRFILSSAEWLLTGSLTVCWFSTFPFLAWEVYKDTARMQRERKEDRDRNISLLVYRLLLFISILLLSASFPLSLWPFHRIDQRHQQQNREQKTLCDVLAGEKEGGRKRDTEREDQRIGDRVGNEMERKEG